MGELAVDNAGDASAANIAMWDGSAWSTVGSGVDNQVRTLALDHSASLNVGGDFIAADGKPSRYVGRWEPVSNLYLPRVAH